ECPMNSPIQSGVIAMPTKPDMLALKIAAGTFPRAIETIITDEVTVEGKAAKNKKASQMVCPFSPDIRGLNDITISGNSTKVEAWINKCNFQLVNPLLN